MKNVVVTAVITAVLVTGIALAVGEWACGKANEVFDAKDVEIEQWKEESEYLTDRVSELGNTNLILCGEIAQLNAKYDGEVTDKQWQDAIDIWEDRVIQRDTEIAEWEACAARRKVKKGAKPTLPVAEIQPTFTDRVQTSLKGVVHLQAPDWQGSGFVVGPRLIVTARHCVEGVEDFEITTHDGHKLKATRAISDKEHDVAFIWIDDLECVRDACFLLGEYKNGVAMNVMLGEHEAVLHSLPLGSIKDCVLMQPVYVIGSPYGKVNFNSVTTGVISGVDRDWDQLGYDYGWKVAFTVDSAGHPGNSGCPVFTIDGVVRGILVGGFSPVLISVMPCDLFIPDLEAIRLMFRLDRYEREEATDYSEDWYVDPVDPEYY